MCENLPTDLIMHVGGFIHHRDARCMQATCTKWDQAWSSAGLASPHPHVQHIQICDKLNCANRQYIIDKLEPLILLIATDTSETLRVLQFVMLLIPIKITSYIAHIMGQTTIESLCIHSEKSMVFWCNCEHYEPSENIPVVCFKGVDDRDYPWIFMEPDNTHSLMVWLFLVAGSLYLLFIPTVTIITLSTVIVSFVYVIGKCLFLF
jgi:hypothetical protein